METDYEYGIDHESQTTVYRKLRTATNKPR